MPFCNVFETVPLWRGIKTESHYVLSRAWGGSCRTQTGNNWNNVRRWENGHASICSCKPTTESFTGPKERRHLDTDASVLYFAKETREKLIPITRQAVQVKATETAKLLGITDFKARPFWCYRLMRREGLSLRHQTSVCRNIPADFHEKLLYFQRYVTQLRKKQNYTFKDIVNPDEKAMYFYIPRKLPWNAACNGDAVHNYCWP
jgi:hypothetical protein